MYHASIINTNIDLYIIINKLRLYYINAVYIVILYEYYMNIAETRGSITNV